MHKHCKKTNVQRNQKEWDESKHQYLATSLSLIGKVHEEHC